MLSQKNSWNKGLTKENNEIMKNISLKNKGKIRSEETRKKMSEARKGKSPWNKGLTLGKQEPQLIKFRTRNSNKPRSMLSYYKKTHPLLFLAEDIIENKNKNFEVHCKTCKKYFEPTPSQLGERIRALESTSIGYAENNFYCSKECKVNCAVYRKRSDPFENVELPYTREEYQTFRVHVLTRDKNTCQFCGDVATDVHHERPQKVEPFFALDPDFAWSCCEDCHYSKGHTGECNTGNLANKVCSKKPTDTNKVLEQN